LRSKEQEARLTLHEHDDDDDGYDILNLLFKDTVMCCKYCQ